jgi:sterol desaturase/sphingolipid hydroxylase (fatty acid hydroxylase superfamily)
MTTFFEQLLLLVTTPFYVVVIGLEWGLSVWHHDDTYSLSDTATNIYLTGLNALLDVLMSGVTLWFLGLFWLRGATPFEPSGLAYWFALFLLQDFFYYVLHYVDHHCRFFWAMHVTHHSSEHFNFSTGIRSSVLEPLYRMFFFAPITLLGFQPADILVTYAAMQIVGILVHHGRCGRLGPLEWVFVTPSHHRVHHGSNPKYLDKNIGMTLIVWDRLFGTFVPEDPNEPVRYGLTKPLASRGPVNIVVHEWKDMWRDVRNAHGCRERLGYVFARPGWMPARRHATFENSREAIR